VKNVAELKCPFCVKSFRNSKIYEAKKSLYNHIEKEHPEQVKEISPAQLIFNLRNKKTSGKCVMCGKPTNFNEKTEKYERLCSKECIERYRKDFTSKMMKKYGKEHLLNSPEQQKKMLQNRSISGTYIWKNGEGKTNYTGKYEEEFLQFIDLFMDWKNPNDVIMPAPQVFYYKDKQGKDRFYIPDIYIQSLNLIIEIKAYDNNGYRKRDIDDEKRKDSAVKKSGFKYIKIPDRNYAIFFNYLLDLKDGE
jgi:hypothetical protein